MEAEGQQRIVRAEDVAHMGITEILRHAWYIHSQYRALVRAIKRNPPSLAIFIDFPDVNFRLAMHCKRLGVPVLWFVSPQLWAWKRGRLRWVQRYVDRMLVIFPFEEPFYRRRNVNAEFVGHPLATLQTPETSREKYAKQATQISQDHWCWFKPESLPIPMPAKAKEGEVRYELDPARPWIALLPGSRVSEIENNLPTLVAFACQLQGNYEFLVPVAPTITDAQLEKIQYTLGDRFFTVRCPVCPRITFVRDARAALFHARASIVASGTATVQALTIGNPFVVVYRVSPLTFAILKRLVRYPAEIPATPDADGNLPIAMPNLIAGRRIVPELLNDRFTAENLAAALRPLLDDTPARAQMIADLAETRARLLPDPTLNPIHRVCDAAEALLNPATAAVPQSAASRV